MSQSEPTSCHHAPQVNCGDCRLSAICLPISLALDDIAKLDDIVQRGRPLQKGQPLYEAGEDFKAVYALRSGAVKTSTISREDRKSVV